MAVLVEAISVVVRMDAINRKVDGGRRHFDQLIPNATVCSDGELIRFGFMSPQPAKDFIGVLEAAGLTFRQNGQAVDIALVDQLKGKMLPCEWLEFGKLNWGGTGKTVSACWLFDGPRIAAGVHLRGGHMSLATPAGWHYEDSLSAGNNFVPNNKIDARLTFIRAENGLDVFLDAASGKEVYVPSDRKR